MSKKEFEDDGRTIADMSYTRQTPWHQSFWSLNKKKRKNSRNNLSQEDMQMSKEESRKFMFSAILAGLVVALVFIGGFLLFVLFCIYVWF